MKITQRQISDSELAFTEVLKPSKARFKRFCVIGFFALSLMLLISCGGGGGGGGGGSDSSTTSTTLPSTSNPTQIKGHLALALSEGSGRRRAIAGNKVQLVDKNGQILAEATTSALGAFNLTLDLSFAQYPLTLKSVRNGIEYSATIASGAPGGSQTTANINEITTAVAKQFLAFNAVSQQALDAIADLVVTNRFGVNEIRMANVPAEAFLKGDFASPSSLGNIILQTAAETAVNLLEEAERNAPLLNQPAFLENFTKNIRSASNPSEAISALQSQGQNNQLVTSLNSIVAAPPAQVATLNATLLSQLNNQVASLSQAISNLQEEIAQLTEQLANTTTSTSSTTLPTSTTSTSTTTSTWSPSYTVRDLPMPAFRNTTISLGEDDYYITNDSPFTLPENTVSFAIQSLGRGVTFYSLKTPRNTTLHDGASRFESFGTDYANILVPKKPGISATSGRWTYRLMSSSRSATTTMKLVIRSGRPPTSSALTVTPYLTGNRYSPGDLQAALRVMKKIYEDVGVQITMESVERVSSAQYANVNTDFTNSTTAALVSQGAEGKVNLFFIEDLTGARSSVLGISAGIPGSLGIAGNRNGVLIGLAAHRTFGRFNNDLLGETTAHEMGHWLGLFHTTERDGREFDILDDTPQCRRSNPTASNCLGRGGRNLMFWVGGQSIRQRILTRDQTHVIKYSPIARTVSTSNTTSTTSATTSTTTTTTLPLPRTTRLRVNNRTSHNIWYLYVSPSSLSSWGSNQLGSNVLFSGDSYILSGIPCGTSYNMKAARVGNATCRTRRSVYLACGRGTYVWDIYFCPGFRQLVPESGELSKTHGLDLEESAVQWRESLETGETKDF